MTDDSTFKADVAAGKALFDSMRPQLEALFRQRGLAGGNPRDVCISFLGCVGGWIARSIGPNAAIDLYKNTLKTLKKGLQ